MAHYRIIGNALGSLYTVTSSMNMNESAVNMHMVLMTYRLVSMAERTLNYGTGDLGSIHGAVHFFILFFGVHLG
jgi:hypothetical protein